MARILIVEDEAQIRNNLVRFLTLEGHSVISVNDGSAGLESMRTQVPQLVICDFMMPRMNGFELLAIVQTDDTLRQVPFIMLSASAEPERLEHALSLGACAYVTKPFQLAHLRALIDKHLLPPLS